MAENSTSIGWGFFALLTGFFLTGFGWSIGSAFMFLCGVIILGAGAVLLYALRGKNGKS